MFWVLQNTNIWYQYFGKILAYITSDVHEKKISPFFQNHYLLMAFDNYGWYGIIKKSFDHKKLNKYTTGFKFYYNVLKVLHDSLKSPL